jgi:hypothetical protein
MSNIFSFEWLSSVFATALALNIVFYVVTTWSSPWGHGSEARKAERDARVRRASQDDRYHAALVMAASACVMTIVAAHGLTAPTKPALLGATVALVTLL